MIIVTGGAGFIGSNIVKALNNLGKKDILVVDDFKDGTKFRNLVGCDILDYLDKEDIIAQIKTRATFADKIIAVFHQGACTDTTEWDGQLMMRDNYEYSKALFHYCIAEHIQFIYASSAAIYGGSKSFTESSANELPLNIYGYSKLLFDRYVQRFLPNLKSQVVGLRYFNVYGPHEEHKGKMASVALHFNKELQATGKVRLFAGSDGYADGEQRRDFIYVGDVADVNLWFWQHPKKSGIYNLGTGRSETFNAVAREIIAWHKHGQIEYIPFPEQLRGSYQSYTQADISKLRAAGYDKEFKTVTHGVKAYLDWLNRLVSGQ